MGRSVEHDAPARFAYVSVICTYDPRPNFHGRLGNAQEKEACNPRGVGLALLRCVRFTEQEENEEEEDGDADGGGGHRGAEGTPPLPLALPLDTNSQGCPKRCRSHLAARLKAAFLATASDARDVFPPDAVSLTRETRLSNVQSLSKISTTEFLVLNII